MNNHKIDRSGRLINTTASFAALLGVALLAATSIGQTRTTTPATSPARQGTVSALLVLGFTPEALALGGASGPQLSALRTAAADLSAEFKAFRAADENLRRLQAEHD